MKLALRFDIIERSVVQDRNLLYTIISYFTIFAAFMNLNSIQSPLIGLAATMAYCVINSMFLGNAFFEKENASIRLVFGMLLLLILSGFVGWLTLIIYNLDATRVILVLLVVGTLSSLLNRRMKHRNADK